jgi:hypothetical protein
VKFWNGYKFNGKLYAAVRTLKIEITSTNPVHALLGIAYFLGIISCLKAAA